MNPFRTRHKNVVFANGGGCQTPPLSLQAVQAFFQKHPTMNKICIKHKIILELVKIHYKGILFVIGGALCHIMF